MSDDYEYHRKLGEPSDDPCEHCRSPFCDDCRLSGNDSQGEGFDGDDYDKQGESSEGTGDDGEPDE